MHHGNNYSTNRSSFIYQASRAFSYSALPYDEDSIDVSQHVVQAVHNEKVSQKVTGGLKGHSLY